MFCPTCGTQIPDDSSFCLKCGRSMSVAPNAPTLKEAAGSPRRPLRLGLFGGGAAALVALGFAVYYLNEVKASTGAPVLPTTGSSSAPVQEAPPIKLSPGDI